MNKTQHPLFELINQRILVLDGAMGTMIQRHKLEEEDYRGTRFASWPSDLKGNNDLLVLTQPAIIADIHTQYLRAGADLIETNTFNANRVSMADYGMQELVHELNLEAAKLAVACAKEFSTPDKPRYAVGSLGPTNRTASLSPDVNRPAFRAISFDELYAAYREQALGLREGGVEVFLVETVFDTLNAKAALLALQDLMDEWGEQLPIMVSGTITDASGRTLSGQTAEAFLISMQHVPLLSIGFNCALGADQLLPHVQAIAGKSPFAISAYPNAGLPNAFGQYDQGPDEMEALMRPYFELGLLNVVGGCCGTTPEHIAMMARLAGEYGPRVIDNRPQTTDHSKSQP